MLRVPIYVTTCVFFKANPVNHKICQIAIRRSVYAKRKSQCLAADVEEFIRGKGLAGSAADRLLR